MEEDLGLIGASAEDTEAELIRKICETELLAGKKKKKKFGSHKTTFKNPFLKIFYNV